MPNKFDRKYPLNKVRFNAPELTHLWVDESKALMSFHEQIIQTFMNRTRDEWEEKLKNYVITNLKQLGYTFQTEDEFVEFFKKRIVRLSFDDKPKYFEFFLDYADKENTGVFLGAYSERVDFTFKDNKITATIGRDFGR